MTDYTKLIDDACECASQIGITEAGRAHGCFTADDSRFLTAMQQSKSKHVAALQSAIEALQAEVAEHKENAIRNARIAVSIRAERDQLQAKLDAMGKGEPVGFMSPQQLELIKDPEDESGHYIPLRKTAAGNFVMALYAAPKALAPLTQPEVVEAFCNTRHNTQYVSVFDAGVRFAEKHHGIGGTP